MDLSHPSSIFHLHTCHSSFSMDTSHVFLLLECGKVFLEAMTSNGSFSFFLLFFIPPPSSAHPGSRIRAQSARLIDFFFFGCEAYRLLLPDARLIDFFFFHWNFWMRTEGSFCVEVPPCEDRVLDGPASGGKGSKGRNYLRRAVRVDLYRGTSLIRNTPLLGPCGRTMPRALWWS